jgi:hypothetical protein
VFKVKPGHLDTLTHYKSQFVLKGYSQVKSIDFNEYATYAPVVGYCVLRVILSICATFDHEMAQLDIKKAFLYGLVDEEIYIQQPGGFILPGSEHLVGRLLKCIHGQPLMSETKNLMIFSSFLASHVANTIHVSISDEGKLKFL